MGPINSEGRSNDRSPPPGPNPYEASSEAIIIGQFEQRIQNLTSGRKTDVISVFKFQTHRKDGSHITATWSDSSERDIPSDIFVVDERLPGNKDGKSQTNEYIWSKSNADRHVLDHIDDIGKILKDLEEAAALKESGVSGQA